MEVRQNDAETVGTDRQPQHSPAPRMRSPLAASQIAGTSVATDQDRHPRGSHAMMVQPSIGSSAPNSRQSVRAKAIASSRLPSSLPRFGC